MSNELSSPTQLEDLKPLAFPVYQIDPMHPGLTKRELFAAMSMQGMLAFLGFDGTGDFGEFAIARMSVAAADALIEALEKGEK